MKFEVLVAILYASTPAHEKWLSLNRDSNMLNDATFAVLVLIPCDLATYSRTVAQVDGHAEVAYDDLVLTSPPSTNRTLCSCLTSTCSSAARVRHSPLLHGHTWTRHPDCLGPVERIQDMAVLGVGWKQYGHMSGHCFDQMLRDRIVAEIEERTGCTIFFAALTGPRKIWCFKHSSTPVTVDVEMCQ